MIDTDYFNTSELKETTMSKKISSNVEANNTNEAATVVENAAPVSKVTAVEDRLYKLAGDVPTGMKSKQASIVLSILKSADGPMKIADVAPLAEKAGLVAKGGVEPSVRYHLHHLTKGGVTEVTNPTFILS